jgi:adenine-specific DNA-methyltransferase
VKGFFPTPERTVDLMIDKLFRTAPPNASSVVLDPGCGQGAFIEGIIRWCRGHSAPLPRIVGIESDPHHLGIANRRFSSIPQVQLHNADFLMPSKEQYDYIVGNPPYVPITQLSEAERSGYRRGYTTAQGRFDLYLLFMEQALSILKPGGRLVFITPEKYLYVDTASPLRKLLLRYHIQELHFVDEQTFDALVTYPLVSTIVAAQGRDTRILLRNGDQRIVALYDNANSWLPAVLGSTEAWASLRLGDVCSRISCGVATGADAVFVVKSEQLEPALRQFARPTIAGRDLRATVSPKSRNSLLLPYTESGTLIGEDRLGALGDYLNEISRREHLVGRTCVQRKPWYAFHETPPMAEVLKPKLLCKDITATPFFVADCMGDIIPRHSVYYIVPRDPGQLRSLEVYLNSETAHDWLRANCQRAANGFLRLQSSVLKRLPVPDEFAGGLATPCVRARHARSA